ncbi:hypothetical protein ACRN91_14920 [Shewanella baltica]|uniref:hypothetical protein n=1 Tax=Shewanella baltica TaxID=62322 RepID=UPI003D7AA983
MSFEANVKCDAYGCHRSIELNSSDPADAENEYHDLTEKGWLIDVGGFDYCPKHAPIVKAEMEQD